MATDKEMATAAALLLFLAITPSRADEAPTEFSAGAFMSVCITREIESHKGQGGPLVGVPDCQGFLKDIEDEELFYRRNHRY